MDKSIATGRSLVLDCCDQRESLAVRLGDLIVVTFDV